MKKKGMTYFMLVFVLSIWGKVMYDIFIPKLPVMNNFGDSHSEMVIEEVELELFDYKLLNNYRDPFLGIVKKTKHIPKVSGVKVKRKVSLDKGVVSSRKWPKLRYNGKMKNKTSQLATAFIKINDKDALMREGEERNEIKLVKIFKDSVWIRFDEELKSFKYQK